MTSSLSLRLALLPLAFAVGGCHNSTEMSMDAGTQPDLATPPMICKTPQPYTGAWFEDVTAEMLTTPNPGVLSYAVNVHAADLDGDGYPDLITSSTSGTRDPPNMPMLRTRFVWMNRPDPSDPSGKKRIFIDGTDASNLMATRDGKGGYNFGVANIGDVNNDGFPDVVVGSSWSLSDATDPDDPGNVMLNDGHGHFHLGPESALSQETNGFTPATAALFDFDRDGQLDYIPTTFSYPPPNMYMPMLFKGSGDGRFTDVAMMMGLVIEWSNPALLYPSAYGITVCDLDMDGKPDILFADYGREPNAVFINAGDHFNEVGVATGIAYDDRMDISDDQSYRCFCMNNPAPGTCNPMPPPPTDVSICTGFGIPGAVDGRGWTPGYSDQPWALGGNNFTLACADIDDDGDMDIFSADIRHGDVGTASDPSELIINNTPPGMPLMKFSRPGNAATGLATRPENGIDWNEGDITNVIADIDNDGQKDLYLCSSDYPSNHGWVWRQKPDHTFEDVTQLSGIGQAEAHGIAFADFDRDGDLDVAIGTSTARGGALSPQMHIYKNVTGQAQNWVQVQLVGKGKGFTNVSAIGALVKVTAGGKTQMQEVSGGYGSSSTQSDLVLTFGLGATCTIDKIDVRWLDATNTVTTFTGVQANYRVRFTEGQTAFEYVP